MYSQTIFVFIFVLFHRYQRPSQYENTIASNLLLLYKTVNYPTIHHKYIHKEIIYDFQCDNKTLRWQLYTHIQRARQLFVFFYLFHRKILHILRIWNRLCDIFMLLIQRICYCINAGKCFILFSLDACAKIVLKILNCYSNTCISYIKYTVNRY